MICIFNRHISHFSTQRAYILKKELADLETALVRYTLKFLADKVRANVQWFQLIKGK